MSNAKGSLKRKRKFRTSAQNSLFNSSNRKTTTYRHKCYKTPPDKMFATVTIKMIKLQMPTKIFFSNTYVEVVAG